MLCAFTMLWLHALNKSKIAQCEREGLTTDKSEAFTELGDGSPLYRFVHRPFKGNPACLDISSQIYVVNMCSERRRGRILFKWTESWSIFLMPCRTPRHDTEGFKREGSSQSTSGIPMRRPSATSTSL